MVVRYAEKKMKMKTKKKAKTATTSTSNKSTNIITNKTDVNKNSSPINTSNQSPHYNPYFNHNLPPPPYYYSHYYHPPSYDHNRNSSENLQLSDTKSTSLTSLVPIESNSTSEVIDEPNSKDRKVQFNLPNEDLQQSNDDNNIVESLSDKKSTRSKRTTKSTRGKKNQKSNPPLRKSPRKRGGILDIAVNKIIEIDDDDDDDVSQKTDSFMDTESDYHTQNDEEMHDDDISN